MSSQANGSTVQKSELSSEGRTTSSRGATPSVRPSPVVTDDPLPTKSAIVAPSTLTAGMALALAQHFGLTDADIAFVLAAQAPTPEEAQLDARVNPTAIARAYTPMVTRVLAEAHCPIAVESADVSELEAHAARVRHTAKILEKFTEGTRSLERATRGDADVLDKVTREIIPQIKARAAVVKSTETTYSSVIAYHHARYPGPSKKVKKPEPDA